MSVLQRTSKKYVVLGGQPMGELNFTASKKGAECVKIEDPSVDIWSPRTENLSEEQYVYHPGHTLFFSIGICKDNDGKIHQVKEYRDIYHFVLACRANKETKNYYLPRPAGSPEDLEKSAQTPYNLVSGEKLPDTDREMKETIYRYMMVGLHTLHVFEKAGLGKKEMEEVNKRPHPISAGGHVFCKGDGSVANTSNLFLALMVDYYKINSGIVGMESQIAFTRNQEYRLLVFTHLKNIFVAFVLSNISLLESGHDRGSKEGQNGYVNEGTDTKEIIKLSITILDNFISQ
jgi:hypothetical protein